MVRLFQLRKRIDQIDLKLLQLLNRRANLVLQIGQLKKKRGLAVFDGKREKDLLKHLAQGNPGPLSSRAIGQIFAQVLKHSRKIQTK